MRESYEIYLVGKVLNGVLYDIDWGKLKREAAYFEGKGVELILRQKKKRRTIQQNKFMWVTYTMIGDEIGWTPEEVHSFLSDKFLKADKPNQKTGVIERVTRSTSSLTTVEMMEYLDQVHKWAASECAITLPLPNESLTF